MDKATKERLQAIIEAKKNKKGTINENRKNIYRANGEKRKGIKNHKQGGLFDK